jgi:transcriptional activator Myb
MVKADKAVEDFTASEWEKIAEIVPTKDAKKCKKRWLFMQKLGGNKTKWSNHEDRIMKDLVQKYGAKDWSSIANQLYEQL